MVLSMSNQCPITSYPILVEMIVGSDMFLSISDPNIPFTASSPHRKAVLRGGFPLLRPGRLFHHLTRHEAMEVGGFTAAECLTFGRKKTWEDAGFRMILT